MLFPGRESYDLLQRLGAERVNARLDEVFCQAQTWEALTVLGRL